MNTGCPTEDFPDAISPEICTEDIRILFFFVIRLYVSIINITANDMLIIEVVIKSYFTVMFGE